VEKSLNLPPERKGSVARLGAGSERRRGGTEKRRSGKRSRSIELFRGGNAPSISQ
jgi:hypothetical protein